MLEILGAPVVTPLVRSTLNWACLSRPTVYTYRKIWSDSVYSVAPENRTPNFTVFTLATLCKRGTCCHRVSVRPSHACIVSKRLNVGSRKQRHLIALGTPVVGGRCPIPPEICAQWPTPCWTQRFCKTAIGYWFRVSMTSWLADHL